MNFVGKKIGGHYVEKRIRHEFGVQDPYHVVVEWTDDDGKMHTKKTKREVPEGLSERDQKVLKKLKKRAYRLELAFSIFGFNVGWTSLIGLVPIVGTIINLYLGYGTIKLAEQIEGGLNNWDRSRMVANVGVDTGMGLIPLLGDIMQAIYKGNTRNVIIAESILEARAKKNMSGKGLHTNGAAAPPLRT